MAASKLLVRYPVLISEELPTVATQDQHLAAQAQRTFGYTVLAKAIHENTGGVLTQRRLLGLKLARTLDRLEIDPFTKTSVAQYKAEQVKLQNSKVPFKHQERVVRSFWGWWYRIYFGGLIAALGAFACGCASYILGQTAGGNTFMAAAGICFFSAVAYAILSFAFFPKIIHSWKWQRVRINEYQKPIPQFALQKAVQIARTVPEVEIYVDELVLEKWNGDPFLVAVCGDREEYFEVFDEPAFERNL